METKISSKEENIIRMLNAGHTYDEIHLALRVSNTIISRIKRKILKIESGSSRTTTSVRELKCKSSASKFLDSQGNSVESKSNIHFAQLNKSKQDLEKQLATITAEHESEAKNLQESVLTLRVQAQTLKNEIVQMDAQKRQLHLRIAELTKLLDELKQAIGLQDIQLNQERARRYLIAFVHQMLLHDHTDLNRSHVVHLNHTLNHISKKVRDAFQSQTASLEMELLKLIETEMLKIAAMVDNSWFGSKAYTMAAGFKLHLENAFQLGEGKI